MQYRHVEERFRWIRWGRRQTLDEDLTLQLQGYKNKIKKIRISTKK